MRKSITISGVAVLVLVAAVLLVALMRAISPKNSWASDRSVDSHATSAQQDARGLIQTCGKIRVTLLGVSRGVAYWEPKRSSTFPDIDGSTRYLRALFLVEKLAKFTGKTCWTGMRVFGPDGGEVGFHRKSWGPSDGLGGSSGLMGTVPSPGKDAVESFVYQQLCACGETNVPNRISLSTRFFDEEFRFDGIELP